MRCPDCNKFVSFDEPEVEVDAEDMDDAGHYVVTVHVMLNCAECGTTLKGAYLDAEADVEHTCAEDVEIDADNEDTGLALENVDASGCDRYQDTDKKGKKIKSVRYMKHYYGAELTLHCKCKRCGEEFTHEARVEEQSSAFEEV